MPRCKDKPTNIDPQVWPDVLQIRADSRTPQAKAAAKLTRAAEKTKVRAKKERDKQPKDKVPKVTGRIR